MHPSILCLSLLLQAAEPPRPAPQPHPAAPQPAPPAAKGESVRSAPCTLTIKGRTEFNTSLPSKKAEETRNKRILEDFSYTLPGTLSEMVYSNGEVEFVFTPAENPAAAGAKATLHLEDDLPAPGWAPVSMDATRIQNAGRMVFKALGRGQGIFATGGAVVNLKGRLASLSPLMDPKKLGETENRPVASTPFPLLEADLRKVGLPAIQFQGAALWSWSNSPGPVTLRGFIDYKNLILPRATVNGRVDLTFEIGATAK